MSPASDEYAVYGGGVVLMLAVWWVACQWKARRADRFGMHVAGFGVVGLWLATGSYGKLYYFQTWLPLVSRFRAPLRYTVFTQWALAVLAALAVARLVRRDREDAQRGAPDERGPLVGPCGALWRCRPRLRCGCRCRVPRRRQSGRARWYWGSRLRW